MKTEGKKKILIVDDDEDILDLLQYNLSKEGYQIKTTAQSDEAVRILSTFHPDLVILDLMMSPYNGIDLCRIIRSEKSLEEVYIFFLTAKSDHYYRQAVYDVGGDEFVEKIVGLKPLMAKIGCVLRDKFIIRKRNLNLSRGPVHLNRGLETVSYNGLPVHLNSTEFEILFFLMQNEGKFFSPSQIIVSLWGSKTFMDENTVINSLDNLRRKVDRRVILERRINSFAFNAKSA